MIEIKVETSKNVIYKNVPPAIPWSNGNQHHEHDTTYDDNGDDDDDELISFLKYDKDKKFNEEEIRTDLKEATDCIPSQGAGKTGQRDPWGS